MVYITRFRTNDLSPSKGKQIEFNSGIASTFFGFSQSEYTVKFECRSLANDLFKKTISVFLKLSPERGDYKIYQNHDGSADLKDVFLSSLGLTLGVNKDDYYAIRKKDSEHYVLYYIPKDLFFSKFFPAIAGDQVLVVDDKRMPIASLSELGPYQLITYGAPGTGKSHKTKEETDKWKANAFRTTFHPDSDYSTFVGAYKPSMSDDAGRIEVFKGSGASKVLDATHEVKKGISYEFIPQAFIKAYVFAWRKMNDAPDGEDGKPNPEPVFLVIEEINRGNCAQIFGDIFQLLDRDDAGYSEYPIDADEDLRKFLSKPWDKVALTGGIGDIDADTISTRYGINKDEIKLICSGKHLVLPPNLLIRATMNTSDQSLFPIDSAFKRRWDWEYVPIKNEGKGWYVTVGADKYLWWSFLEKINAIVYEETQSADKQLGYFFVKLPSGQQEIDLNKFVNKVAFYLWNDVFKDCEISEDALKRKDASGKLGDPIKFTDFFKRNSSEIDDSVVRNLLEGLGVEKVEEKNSAEKE